MLTRWLSFVAFLAGSANLRNADSGWNKVTVAPTCRVKGQPEAELVLGCGDGKYPGVVQFWHTPFGDLQTSASRTNIDPVFLNYDGSLVISNSSIHHSGLYYCAFRHTDRTTLWPYELHVGHYNLKEDQSEQESSCPAHRFRRNLRLEEENPAVISDKQFLEAVVASVLVTFVVGFSIGALTRSHVLRCLQVVTMRLQLPKQRRHQTDMPDHSSQVTMATLPPMYDNQGFETEVMHNNPPTCGTSERSVSVTSSSPPAKPKRSFRNKQEEEPETKTYLEGCDYTQEMESEEVAGKDKEKMKEMSDEEAKKVQETSELPFYLLEDEDDVETIQHETDEDKCGENREENNGGDSSEEKKDWGLEKVEEAGEQENRIKEVVRRDEKEEEQITEEVKETHEEAELPSPETEDKEGSHENKERMKNDSTEGETHCAPRRGSRVIRLYQYNEDGQRYSHLPEHDSEDPEPAPALKRRSLSLTRLNAIMAAASAGPMDRKESGEQQSEEHLQHFHMEI